MTLKQEAYKEINKLSEEDIRIIILLMKRMQPSSGNTANTSISGKAAFMASAGKIDIDEEAVYGLRKFSANLDSIVSSQTL